jgi:hypothetical protein
VTGSDQIYTYLPYQNEDINRPDTTPVYVGKCQDSVDPFFQKLPKFWRNTTVKVLTKCIAPYVECVGEISGPEIQIFNLVQGVLKFKTEYVLDKTMQFGMVKTNGSYSASFRCLQERQVDMSLGAFRSIGHTQFRDFDFSTNHMEDRLVWVVPKALPLAHWIRIVKTFELKFWITLIILTVIVSKIIQKISLVAKEPSKIFYQFPLQVAVRLLVGRYLKQTPTKLQVRIVFIFWVYFCMLFNIIFNSNLINVFFGSFHTFQIDSFHNIMESNLDVGLTDDVKQILGQEPNSSLFAVKKDILTCPFGVQCLNRTLFARDLVCCWGKRSIMNRMATSYNIDVHFIDDHLLFFYIFFYFVKGYPVVPQVSRAIVQLKSVGLVQHVMDKIDHPKANTVDELTSKVLTFKLLEGPFYLVFLGWLCALLVFGAEVIHHRWSRVSRKTKKEG